MKRPTHLRFKVGDLLAIAMVILLAVGVMLVCFSWKTGSENALVLIYQDGELLDRRALDNDCRISVGGEYTNIIAIENGRAAIVESDCPGADCVHSGWIDRSGRSIVCLPNRVELRIEGADGDVDFVVR